MTIEGYPILERLLAQGAALSAVTQDWTKKWRGMDLDSAEYEFKELSGSTSINMKIRKVDPTDPQGYKSRGSFVPLNGAANPDTEIAYFTWLLFWATTAFSALQFGTSLDQRQVQH
ncbi:MAG TPA: hypothetical protein VK555_12370 [Terriglobales bacterium]|nr:hypothetical protein [Terriglobales bacterium]